ncbi:hypothetical protein F2P79_025889, partial [Pimephales promelas]
SLLIVCVSSSIAVPVVSIQLRVNVGTKQHSSTTVLISQESSVLHKQNPSMKVHIRICTAPHVNKHQKDLSNKLVLREKALKVLPILLPPSIYRRGRKVVRQPQRRPRGHLLTCNLWGPTWLNTCKMRRLEHCCTFCASEMKRRGQCLSVWEFLQHAVYKID